MEAESTTDESDGEAVDDHSLFACIPPLPKNESGRQIDHPLHKMAYWDTSDRESWHLDYPEMTQRQYNAFERAAEKRNEEFGPGKSPLWDLAMRYFPPTRTRDRFQEHARPLELRPALLRRDSRTVGQGQDWDIPPTAPPPTDDDPDDALSIPDTLPPDTQAPLSLQSIARPKTEVAWFRSAPGSLLPGISFALADPILSWGRERHNTVVYEPVTEAKVPKNAFRILLWRDGYTASANELRPWDSAPSPLSRTIRASPDPNTFAFYISTKATSGVRINNNPLLPSNPKDNKAPCKYWMKLYHGDIISFWGSADVKYQATLTFECRWGGSAVSRPPDEPPTCVPGPVARKLDSLWPKASKHLEYDRIKAKASQEHDLRMRHPAREIERSRLFELKREEAVRILSQRTSRGPSPASAAPMAPRVALWPSRTTSPAL